METTKPIRILIVDDSRIFRGQLQSLFDRIPDVQVIGSVFNGEKALEFIQSTPPDLVTLDVEMPGLGGIATLREINRLNKSRNQVPVDTLLISSLTQKGSRFAIEGLQLGALDFIFKPSEGDEHENRESLFRTLSEKLQSLRYRRDRLRNYPPVTSPAKSSSPIKAGQTGSYRAIAIGTSTGGPEALSVVLPSLTRECQRPIFIVQHILDGLSFYLAESLTKQCGRPVIEVLDEIPVKGGGIYLAKSGRHMTLRMRDGNIHVASICSPPERGCRPSVDLFFKAAASLYGTGLVAAILTGMGDDGSEGIKAIKRSGGYLLAQDQESSIVWGMPRAAVATGLVDEVVPLMKIANRIASLASQRDI